MADVMRTAAGARDRGQMLLIAAFGVAVMLVALALILNTAIYTENIATRGSDISGGKDAQRYRAVTEATFRSTIEYVNYHNNSSYANLRTPARYAVWNYSNMSGRQQSVDSIVANVSVKQQPTKGTRIYQNGGGDMTNERSAKNWTVANETGGVRDFVVVASSLEEDDPNTVSPNHQSKILFANFTDSDPGEEEWYSVYMLEDGGEVVVIVTGSDGTNEQCKPRPYDSGEVTINVTEGLIDGERCKALSELESIYTDPFDLQFNNTDDADIDASYSMVVDKNIGSLTLRDTDTAPPHETPAIYEMTVRLTYESKRLYYATDIRVAPGEPDA